MLKIWFHIFYDFMLNGGPAIKEFELISLETTTYTNLCLKYKKTSNLRK